MGKGGVFSARRYLGGPESGPGLLRRDGRALRRPLRLHSEAARAAAHQHRGRRRQPPWPRVLGIVFVGMSLVAGATTEYPVPRPSPAALSAAVAPSLLPIEPVAPVGPGELPGEFRWRTEVAPPFTLVVSDAGYRELFRLDGLARSLVSLRPEWRALLAGGGTFHWHVLARRDGRQISSPFVPFAIR